MYGYASCLDCGWPDGVHDVRAHSYEHPWLVLCHKSDTATGCWSRAEARRVWAHLQSGRPLESMVR
jgi:hypothetical protein